MNKDPITVLADLRSGGFPCALITVVGATGSTPRKAGAKMVVSPNSPNPTGTIGGGKLEALAIKEAQRLLSENVSEPLLRTYPLHEADEESFGAICGGEVILLTEAFPTARTVVIVGAGHCGSAIARTARGVGFSVLVVDDRQELTHALDLESIPTAKSLDELTFISGASDDSSAQTPLSFVAVSRNFETDLEALRRILPKLDRIPYVGMIGSRRKVRRVMDTLRSEGAPDSLLERIYAPIGLDIGAESPGEIALSVVAQILSVTRGKSGGNLSAKLPANESAS